VFVIGFAGAAMVAQYVLQTTVIIEESKVTVTLDGVTLADGSITPMDWGTLLQGEEMLSGIFSVTNNGELSVTLELATSIDLAASGLTLTWEHQGATLDAATTLAAPLVLSADVDALLATVNFDITLTINDAT